LKASDKLLCTAALCTAALCTAALCTAARVQGPCRNCAVVAQLATLATEYSVSHRIIDSIAAHAATQQPQPEQQAQAEKGVQR
jgi:hypothetical protein